ncbi:MAG: DNA polymerase III subunit delta' [Burkholderiales bacterium]|nr:DNA polymerase III subunit delta' [Burkholderiales bacterium]
MVEEADPVPAAPWPELLPWQAAPAVALLAKRATLPHALLITGPGGIGKRAFALNVARALLCESPRSDALACGACPSCTYAASAQHPDLLMVQRIEADADTEEKKKDPYGVDRIRELTEWATLTSHRGGRKVAIVYPAESLNVSSGNALLKTLEEPPPDTYLLLVSHQPGRIPATLRSRCGFVAAPRPSADEARQWLQAQGVTDATAILAQAGGAPLRALALAEPAWQEERGVWLAALAKPSALPAVALAARLEARQREERKDRLGFALDWLLAWTADLARAAAGAPPLRNPDFADALHALAATVAPVALFRYHRLLLRQRALVAHPLQPKLVAESLLFAYRDLFR